MDENGHPGIQTTRRTIRESCTVTAAFLLGCFPRIALSAEASYGETAVQLVTLYGHLRSSNHLVGNIVWHLRQAARALLKGARSKATVPTSPIRECGWPKA